ncbi:MAG: hypothetical protein E7527_02670 [Ruminococcaceae bacterium]|nr:hypothetical protein [Oscillospiraceae bacterium]
MSQSIAVGSYVLYGKTGVCLVQEKKTIAMGKEKNQYFVLCPVSDGRSSVFVPCDNEALLSKISPLLTREEIDLLLSDADSERLQWIDDRSARIAFYRTVTTGNDRRMLIRLICCLFRKKEERQALGKRLSSMDDATLQECMRLIDEEFSMVLSIPRKEVVNYILQRL